MKTTLLALACALCATSLPAQTAAEAPPIAAPTIERSADVVTITSVAPGTVVRYSIDGSDPGPKGGPYLAPILLPHGGKVRARAFSEDRKTKSDLAEAAYASDAAIPSTLVPCTQDRDWPTYDWAKRHAAVSEIVRTRKPALVFIGDSITQMFGGEPHDRGQPGKDVWEKFYGGRNAANLGFGYDFVENTLWRLQHGELDGAAPKVAVVLIGTNNVGKNTPAEIVLGIRAILDEIHARTPQTKILLLAILPRGAKPDATRDKLAQINAGLAGIKGVTFLDIGPKLLQPDGSIAKETMGDFLHPTAQGYTLWAEAMEPALRKLLGEPTL